MSLICEIGKKQLIKHGEVTCGDSVEIVHNPDGTIVVLSDGLGSGVKANILSNLTTKIISRMVSKQVPLEDIVETIVGTLPVCSVRHVAYSTFTILKIGLDGHVDIIDFDGLPPIWISKGFVNVVERESQEIAGRTINRAQLQMKEGDYLLITSDGVTEAGLGLTLPMGLQTSGLVKALKENVDLKGSAQHLVDQVVGICMSYYISEPGDDTTAVAVHLRQANKCALLTGVPMQKTDDAKMIADFLSCKGRKIICGGTTAQVFAREANRELKTAGIYTLTGDVPPISKIDGIDLVTEGVITMNYCNELLEQYRQQQEKRQCLTSEEQFTDEVEQPENGATMLMEQLLWADHITILFGTQLNQAYEQIKPGIKLRDVVLEKLTSQLRQLGKEVVIQRY